MSAFPYSQASPPPTAGPLPVIERANLNTPYSGGGGGGGGAISTFNTASISSLSVSSINGASPGGGGGPVPADLAVSTLTAASTITAGSTIQGLAYTAPAISGGGTYLKLGQGSPNQTSLFDVFSNNNDLDMRVDILGFNSGTAAAVGINIFTDEANNRSRIQPQSGSKIVLDAWEIINVSTINGAAPGGGGGPPPAATSTILALTNLSSINDGTPGLLLIAGDVGITGGYLASGNISTNVISPLNVADLTITAASTIIKGPVNIDKDLAVSSINGAAPSGGGVGPNPAFSTVTAQTSLSVTNQNTPGQQLRVEGNSASSFHVICVPGVQTGLSINQASGTVSITNADLSVSSINGLAPGGGGSLLFSTLFSGTSTIQNDPGTAIIFGFSTTIGHTYEIQTQMNIQGFGGQDGTDNDDVVQELVNELTLNTTQGSFISTCEAASRQLNIGTSGMWKAALSSQSLALSGTFSTQAILTRVALLDFGAI